MVRTNMTVTRVKPAASGLVTLHVLRSERISESFQRVTLGGGDIGRFTPMGFDQWFRLFLPVGENSLTRLPDKLDTVAYLRYLAIARTERPVLRNYTVRAWREDGPEGPELDVDFVLHGAGGHAGPAAVWAASCARGDPVAILDEGISFNPPEGHRDAVMLVGDESALPAVAGILASLPRRATGGAVLEVPDASDRRDLDGPEGVDVQWIVRSGPVTGTVPGTATLAAACARPVSAVPSFSWVAGEQALATGMRRHWVRAGVPKSAIAFCGYWRHRDR